MSAVIRLALRHGLRTRISPVVHPTGALWAHCHRHLSSPRSAGEDAMEKGSSQGGSPRDSPAGPKSDEASSRVASSSASASASRSAITITEDEDAAPPPMEWEPGVAGTVQKGLSAVVIAFGAAAFGICAFGAYLAFFPSNTSPGVIMDDAMSKVRMDAEIADRLGTPLRAFGMDFGGGEGRRNFIQSWTVDAEDGSSAVQIKFNVQGPLGRGWIHVQVPAQRTKGQFNFIMFENRSRREPRFFVLDNRPDPMIRAPPSPSSVASEPAGG